MSDRFAYHGRGVTSVGVPPTDDASGDDVGLSRRVANMARAVADVVEQRCSATPGAAQAVTFLREWADATFESAASYGLTPMQRLVAYYGLIDAEVDLLILAGMPDEHEGLAATLRTLHPQGEPRPTVGLAALVRGGGQRDRDDIRALITEGAIVRQGLVTLRGTGTFFERSVGVADGLWEVLHGLDGWPAALPRVHVPAVPLGLDGWLGSTRVARAAAVLARNAAVTVTVAHADELVATTRCVALSHAAGRPVTAVRAAADDAATIRLLAAHAVSRDALPLLVADPPVDSSQRTLGGADLPGPLLVCAPTGVQPAPGRPIIALDAEPVDIAGCRTAWRTAVPALAQRADVLAARHPLDPARTAELAADVALMGEDIEVADVSTLIRTRASVSLPVGVDLISPNLPWSALVLPTESDLQLRDAVARLDNQAVVLDEWGLAERAHATHGARLLFTGGPGTGKSLAARAVAAAVGTDLLVVDVSRVVSKWLGETEKNLAAAFEAAERTQAVLVLDEADALFGTRTEISDAHDRYANLETAYLLQRLERFEGLAILTTNLRANIDPAFIRRMDYVVDFPLPDLDGRVALWEHHLPTSPVLGDDVDLDALARLYVVPGGWIRNAAVDAAFSAAAGGGALTQEHLVAALRREYAKAAMPFPGEPARRRHEPV